MKATDFVCSSVFGTPAEAIKGLGRWASMAQAAGQELSDMVALVAISSSGVQVQLAPRSLLAPELDMVEHAELLGVLATPDDPGQLRVMWSTEGRDDVRNATLADLTSKLVAQPTTRHLQAVN
jgi:hypothetical protein